MNERHFLRKIGLPINKKGIEIIFSNLINTPQKKNRLQWQKVFILVRQFMIVLLPKVNQARKVNELNMLVGRSGFHGGIGAEVARGDKNANVTGSFHSAC